MTASSDKLQRWAMARIEEAFPPDESLSAIDDLYRVEPFFAGETPLLFGMKTVPTAFADPAALVERARAGLLAWFEHLGATGDHAAQAKLYRSVRAFAPHVAEPELIRQETAAALADAHARQAALADIPRPMQAIAAVSPQLASALARLRDGRADDFFETHGKRLTAACGLKRFAVSLEHFEWEQEAGGPLDPDWESLVAASFDPPFFPFAGSDGDYIGVLVVAASDDAPVTVYSHEEGYRFIASSLTDWNALCDAAAARSRRRRRPPKVERTAYDQAFDAARAALASSRS
jgi:hypothetical protein